MRNRVILIACVLAGFLWAPYVTAQERGAQEERAAYIVASNCVTVRYQDSTITRTRKIDTTKVHIYSLMNGEGGWVLIDARVREVRDVIYYNLNSGETVCGFRNWKPRKFHKTPGNVNFFASTEKAVESTVTAGSSGQFDGQWEGFMRCESCENCTGPLKKSVSIDVKNSKFDIIPDTSYMGVGVIDDAGNASIEWSPDTYDWGTQSRKNFRFVGKYEGESFVLSGERGLRSCEITLSRVNSPED